MLYCISLILVCVWERERVMAVSISMEGRRKENLDKVVVGIYFVDFDRKFKFFNIFWLSFSQKLWWIRSMWIPCHLQPFPKPIKDFKMECQTKSAEGPRAMIEKSTSTIFFFCMGTSSVEIIWGSLQLSRLVIWADQVFYWVRPHPMTFWASLFT